MTQAEILRPDYLDSIFQEARFPEGIRRQPLEEHASLHHRILEVLDQIKDAQANRTTFGQFFARLSEWVKIAEPSSLAQLSSFTVLLNSGAVAGFSRIKTAVEKQLLSQQSPSLSAERRILDPFAVWVFEAANYLAKPDISRPYQKYLYLYERGFENQASPTVG